MYSLIKQFLFLLKPETSHDLSLKGLKLTEQIGILSQLYRKKPHNPVSILGMNFPNRVGLAAGLDKNADYVEALSRLGFGFIEVGTVTPRPQDGNPKPRLFRLTKDKAIINRMGFNNKGADYVASKLKNIAYHGILGINIGKNKDTPNDKAADDYLFCFRKLWPYASYMTINISSPNTQNLRDLQSSDALTILLQTLKTEQAVIQQQHGRYVPLFVKIAPDLSHDEVESICKVILNQEIDGIIATNTTISRDNLSDQSQAEQTGGLSGKPLSDKSTDILRQLRQHLPDDFPIIAAGGIMDVESGKDKLKAGANLLQVYTGFIYEGPKLIQSLSTL